MDKITSENGDKLMLSSMADYTQKVLDRFFIHQCIVRRFSKRNEEVFQKLVSFRAKLESIVEKDLGYSIPQVHVVYYVMNAMQNSRVLSLLENDNLIECEDFLFDILEPLHCPFKTEIRSLISAETISEIIKLMSDSVSMIHKVMNQTNIFRYYPLYASTIIVNFEDLLLIQKYAESDKLPTYSINTACSPHLTKWLGIIFKPLFKKPECIYDDLHLGATYRDLYCLIKCGGVMRKFNSENIRIIDDRMCDVVIDNKKSDGMLYLSVPYTKLPIDIDEALRLFKNSITGLLIEEGVLRCNTEHADYWNSNFYNKNDGANTPNSRSLTNTVLVKQKNSFLKLQSGLLVWDKVKIRKRTIERALEETNDLLEVNELYSRSESSVKKDYDHVAALINSNSNYGDDILSRVLSKRNDIVVE